MCLQFHSPEVCQLKLEFFVSSVVQGLSVMATRCHLVVVVVVVVVVEFIILIGKALQTLPSCYREP